LTVYGTWFLSVMGFVAVILLIIGLAAYAPIIAVGIALIVAMGILWALARRRTEQVGGEHASAARERRAAGQTDRPSATGAPVSGEGGAAEAQRAARLRGG
jgi:membrane protein implicated in regulation of membrane protease activity